MRGGENWNRAALAEVTAVTENTFFLFSMLSSDSGAEKWNRMLRKSLFAFSELFAQSD